MTISGAAKLSEYKLYLHVGLEKTGTTAIQIMLKEQRDVIEKLYNIRLAPGVEDTELAHHRFAKSFIDDPDEAADIDPMTSEEISEFKLAFLESGQKKFVISSELFVYSGENNINRLRELFLGWDVNVIVFIRPQDQYLSSQYSQYIKGLWRENREIKRIEEFQIHSMDYNEFSLRWEEVFGVDNVRIALLEDKEFPTIFDNFLHIISDGNYCAGDVLFPESNINPALSAVHRKIISEDILRIGDAATRLAIEKLVRTHSDNYSQFSSPILRHNILSSSQRQSIVQRYDQSNRELSIRHFARDVLFEDGTEYINYRDEGMHDLSKIYIEIVAEALKMQPPAIGGRAYCRRFSYLVF